MCVIVILFYFGIKLFAYKVKVFIFSERAGHPIIKTDIGGYFKNKHGTWDFKLLKNRVTIQPPKQKYLLSQGKKDVLFLYQTGIQEYHPLVTAFTDPKGETLTFIGEDEDVTLWGGLNLLRLREIYAKESIWKTVIPLAVLSIVVVGCILIIYFTVDHAQKVIPAMTELAKALRDVAVHAGTSGAKPAF